MHIPHREEILKQKSIELHLVIAGVRQIVTFEVTQEKTAHGTVATLVTKKNITPVGLSEVAEKAQMPVRSPLGVALPKGKMMKDFAEKEG